VTSCEPDFLISIDVGSATPDDPFYYKQWNMPDIQMATAWKTGQFGSRGVHTCVIDTGIDFTHPDLIANLWMNPVEVAGPGANASNGYQNGIDDDGNGVGRPPPPPSLPPHKSALRGSFLRMKQWNRRGADGAGDPH